MAYTGFPLQQPFSRALDVGPIYMLPTSGKDELVDFVEQFYFDFLHTADSEKENGSDNEEDLSKLYELYGARTPRPPTPARHGSKASDTDAAHQISADITRGRLLQRALPVKAKS